MVTNAYDWTVFFVCLQSVTKDNPKDKVVSANRKGLSWASGRDLT